MITSKPIDIIKAHWNTLNKFRFILILLLSVCSSCFSQKQVTIDRNKLAIDQHKKNVTKKQVQTKVKQQPTKKKVYNKKTNDTVQLELASYLKVNGSDSPELTKNVGSNLSYLELDIDTDGEVWDVSYIPRWCSVSSRTDNSLTMYISENNSNEERKDWFMISCDNKSVKIYLVQEGQRNNLTTSVNNITASVNNISVLHNNKLKNGSEGMIVSGSFDVTDCEGLTFYATVFIKNDKDNYLQASEKYPSFRAGSGHFTGIVETTNYVFTKSCKFRMEIPYDSFVLGPEWYNKLNLIVALYCPNNKKFITGSAKVIPFIATVKNNVIQTKDY